MNAPTQPEVAPPIVTAWNAPAQAGRCRLIVLLFLGMLLSIAGGDWIMRIRWFQWHRSLILRPASTFDGPRAPLQTNVTGTSRGGDLSHMLAIPVVAERFEEVRPGATNVTDEFGFRNVPPVSGRAYPVVVVGDSYMYTGTRMEDVFSAQLESRLGVPVYNHAYDGRGPFWGLVRFLLSDRFKAHEPRVLVWGIVERELEGYAFAGIGYQLAFHRNAMNAPVVANCVDWQALSPRRLRTSLPNTSILAGTARKAWIQIRYRALGRLNPDVIPSRDGGQLFYKFSAEPLFWSREKRNVRAISAAIVQVASNAAARNMQLAVVLIPDKERICVDQVPESYIGRRKIVPSILGELAQDLETRGIPAVDLTPGFLRASGAGRQLYWRDDTHWNAEGIRLAADETAALLKPFDLRSETPAGRPAP